MNATRRLLATVIGFILTASTAGAYYHFIHYTSRTAPYNPVAEKFDLNALPSRTIAFFLSDTATGQISRTELPSVLSAIREAARVWSGVETSDLRVTFGGLASSSTPQNTPGVDIAFDEMDPLTLGLTSTNAGRNAVVSGSGGPFVPITRPLVRLNRNLSSWTAPSFTEAFFLTVVHEMGHALGLQHTWTASVMSTDITRATSLYAPLTADDIAGVSLLYPARSFASSTGSISGRVVFPNGGGIHLASVVAIRATGAAISALTDLDGRYRIDGVPPGGYLVYAHPVPPAARAGVAPGDLWLPVDADGRQTTADGPFDTLFYQSNGPGTRDYTQAQTIAVNGGATAENINFALNRRASYSIPSVTTYSYFDQTAVQRGFLNGGGTLVASGSGLTSNGAVAPGLTVSFLGGAPTLASPGGIRAYSGVYLALDLVANFGGAGLRHAVFTLPNDIYVLPNGINLVQTRPPLISSATAAFESNGARSVSVNGTTINPDTKFYFDGVPATLLRFDDATRATIAAPPGLTGLRSVITAFNPDGQNSMFLQANAPATYSYDSGDPGAASFSPSSLQAGAETLVEINGGGAFAEGQTMVGFGSSDVRVRRAWVIGPNKIWANVTAAPNAGLGGASATVMSGFQVISQPSAIQITAANSRTPLLNSQLVNASPTASGVFPGATVILSGSNLAGGTITLGDRPAAVLSSSASQLTFVVPAGVAPGPAILKFTTGSDTASVAVQIDPLPAGFPTVLPPGDTVNARGN